ncbi:MAG TPA: hypothetical protein VF481_11220 [Novosphingobium sp.]
MATVVQDWSGGLEPEIDGQMFTERPADPEMRESASVWFYDEKGEFAVPRIGIEAVGAEWDTHRYDANFAFADGRVLFESVADAKSHSPIDANGKPTILGSGGLSFQCLEPFRRWRVVYEGNPIDASTAQMIDKTFDPNKRTSLRYEVELTTVAPGWVHDNRPEKLDAMDEDARVAAGLMGFGWRVEQLFRAEGELTVDGTKRSFSAVGNRIRRQSVRPLGAFRGHCWQAATFPDGRGFAICCYPPLENGYVFNDAYIFQDGRKYKAKASRIPWLEHLKERGDDVSLELESELGTTRIAGSSIFNTFRHGIAEMPGFTLQQGGAQYTWDGQTAYGMLERSSWQSQID